jgi:hypothetical protein
MEIGGLRNTRSHPTGTNQRNMQVLLEVEHRLSETTGPGDDGLRNKQRRLGRVKFFNFRKGYGFIIPDSVTENEESAEGG